MDHETTKSGTDVDRSPEAICAEMALTRSALTGKLELLEDRVQDKIQRVRAKVDSVQDTVHGAVETVKRTFDLPYQVRQHPWPMVGASVAAGMVLARLVERREPAVEQENYEAQRPNRFTAMFGDELHFLQRTAVGAVMSLVRNSLNKSFPGMAPETQRVIDGLTRKLGGEPVDPSFHSQSR